MFVTLFALFAVLVFFPPMDIAIEKGSYASIHPDYISVENTAVVKGLFVVIVFCSHFLQHVTLPSIIWNNAYIKILKYIGQLMVPPFFFYSGYGIFVSLKRKGSIYIHSFLKKRFFPLWLYFSFCVILYYIMGLLKGKSYDIKTIIYALIGWKSIGNSNWFMFITFVLYILLFISFYKMEQIGVHKALLLFTGASLLLVFILSLKMRPYWYNTLMCFPLGMWFGYYQASIETVFKRHFYVSFLCLILALYLLFVLQKQNTLVYCLYSALFSFVVVVITMKCKSRSPVLSFFGRHVFSIYIMQHFVFLVWHEIIINPYIYFVVSLISTVIIAICLDLNYLRLRQQFGL